MLHKCMNCKSRKDMVRFENETFTTDHGSCGRKRKGRRIKKASTRKTLARR